MRKLKKSKMLPQLESELRYLWDLWLSSPVCYPSAISPVCWSLSPLDHYVVMLYWFLDLRVHCWNMPNHHTSIVLSVYCIKMYVCCKCKLTQGKNGKNEAPHHMRRWSWMLPRELIWEGVAPPHGGMTQKLDGWAIVCNIVKCSW